MATKKITKIISTENGDNYVADIEDIENRITQNSSNLETAKQELTNKCNEALNQAKAYTDQEKANLVKKSGDTLTGEQFARNVNNSSLQLMGGVGWFSGASLQLMGKDHEPVPGGFRLDASSFIDNDHTKGGFSRLQGTVDGSLTWNQKDIERVNAKGSNYIRFDSGVQIEWNSYVAHSKKETVNFLMPFKYPPIMSICLDGNTANNGAINFIGYAHPTATNFISFMNWGGAMVLMYIAIGKWK